MKKRLRILLVQTQAENAGAQEITRLLGDGLAARGHEVFNAFFYRKSANFSEQPNTFYCAPDRPSSPLALARLFWRLAAHIRDTRPDIVLTFQHYGNIVAAPVARIVSAAPIVANQVSALQTMSNWVRTVDRLMGVAGLFDVVTVNSLDLKQIYADYPAAYTNRLVYVAHGFEARTSTLTREEARRAFNIPDDAVVLGCVARLHELKGLDAAVRMLPARPGWTLVLLGQGAEQAALERLAEDLEVSNRLHFVGEVPPARIGDFLKALDVFVFPSKAETFGLAAVEAAQAGVPVVANDLPVLREVLSFENRPAALFVDASRTDDFVSATSSILQNRQLGDDLRQTGMKLSRRYSVEAMVRDYEVIFTRLVK